MKTKRTPLAYIEDDLEFTSTEGSSPDLTAIVTDKPTHSMVLGPDGFPLEYEDEPVGFRLREK